MPWIANGSAASPSHINPFPRLAPLLLRTGRCFPKMLPPHLYDPQSVPQHFPFLVSRPRAIFFRRNEKGASVNNAENVHKPCPTSANVLRDRSKQNFEILNAVLLAMAETDTSQGGFKRVREWNALRSQERVGGRGGDLEKRERGVCIGKGGHIIAPLPVPLLEARRGTGRKGERCREKRTYYCSSPYTSLGGEREEGYWRKGAEV